MSTLERMEERKRIEEEEDESAVRDEEDKEPEDWDEYSAKQRKQRGFHAGDAEGTGLKDDGEVKKDEGKEEDHETMTSGLSENEAGNESAEEGQIEETADVGSSKTVKAEPEASTVSPPSIGIFRMLTCDRNPRTRNPKPKTPNLKRPPKNARSETALAQRNPTTIRNLTPSKASMRLMLIWTSR
jgi:hypothetical protein